jgi:hypothetical protein
MLPTEVRNFGTCLRYIKSNRTKVCPRVSVACMHHERGLFRSLPHFPALPLKTPHSFLLPLLEKITKGTRARTHTHIYAHVVSLNFTCSMVISTNQEERNTQGWHNQKTQIIQNQNTEIYCFCSTTLQARKENKTKIEKKTEAKKKKKKKNKTTVLEASFPPKQVLLKTINSAAESQELRSPGEGGSISCAKQSKQLKQAV